MKNNPFHWGILGLGKIARKFAKDLTSIEGAKLVAVGSRSLERAQAFASEFDVSYAAGSYSDLFNGPRIDAVYIATPHVQHQDLTFLCIEHGVPVLCEKPMGLNYSEVEGMVTAAREKGVYLMEALWSRFTPTTQKVLEIIKQGTIGRVESVRADFGFQLGPNSGKRISDPALGGGSLLDIGIYPVWLCQLLLGEPTGIIAAARLNENGIDLDMHATLRSPDGRLGHAYSTLLGRTKTEALILGEKADIHWHARFHEPSSFSILSGRRKAPEKLLF